MCTSVITYTRVDIRRKERIVIQSITKIPTNILEFYLNIHNLKSKRVFKKFTKTLKGPCRVYLRFLLEETIKGDRGSNEIG